MKVYLPSLICLASLSCPPSVYWYSKNIVRPPDKQGIGLSDTHQLPTTFSNHSLGGSSRKIGLQNWSSLYQVLRNIFLMVAKTGSIWYLYHDQRARWSSAPQRAWGCHETHTTSGRIGLRPTVRLTRWWPHKSKFPVTKLQVILVLRAQRSFRKDPR